MTTWLAALSSSRATIRPSKSRLQSFLLKSSNHLHRKHSYYKLTLFFLNRKKKKSKKDKDKLSAAVQNALREGSGSGSDSPLSSRRVITKTAAELKFEEIQRKRVSWKKPFSYNLSVLSLYLIIYIISTLSSSSHWFQPLTLSYFCYFLSNFISKRKRSKRLQPNLIRRK